MNYYFGVCLRRSVLLYATLTRLNLYSSMKLLIFLPSSVLKVL